VILVGSSVKLTRKACVDLSCGQPGETAVVDLGKVRDSSSCSPIRFTMI
jgi:hypothetical protein